MSSDYYNDLQLWLKEVNDIKDTINPTYILQINYYSVDIQNKNTPSLYLNVNVHINS